MYSRPGLTRLRALEQALLDMPRKRLIEDDLVDCHGDVCLVGLYARDIAKVDVVALQAKYAPDWTTSRGETQHGELSGDDMGEIGAEIGITNALGWEWSFLNDEWWRVTPEQRWEKALAWVRCEIKNAEERIAKRGERPTTDSFGTTARDNAVATKINDLREKKGH